MTHEELCERARRWLSGSRRCDPVFSNIASCREIPDAIGWSGSYQWQGSTVVECKTSVADFHADKAKYITFVTPGKVLDPFSMTWRRWQVTRSRGVAAGLQQVALPRMGDFRFFMCEEGVISLDLVERHAPDHGLIYACGRQRIKIVKPAPRRTELVDLRSELRFLRFAVVNRKAPYGREGAR
jgi:hypothetical protein